MFSVPAYDPLAQFGRSFGAGVGGALQNQSDFMRDRNRLQQGLGQLGDVAKDAGGNINPLDLYIKMQSALAGIPGSQQNISESFPLLYKMLSQQGAFGSPAAEAPPGLAGSPQGAQGQQGQAQQRQGSQQQSQPYELPPPSVNLVPPSTKSPIWGQGPVPSVYSGDDYQRVERDLRAKQYDDNTVSSYINMMQRRDAANRAILKDYEQGFNIQGAQAQAKATTEDRWEDYLKKRSDGLDENEYQQKLRLSKQFENDSDIDSRYRKTESAFKNLQSNLDSFRLNTERGLFYNTSLDKLPERKKAMQNEAKALVKAGFGDEVTKILKQNGYGKAEEFELINPLGRGDRDMVEAAIGKQYRKRDDDIKYLPDDPRFDQQLQKNIQIQEAQKNRLASTLAKNVKQGHIGKGGEFIPGTNLYLLREEAMKRGMSWEDFREAMNKALEKGLKLDDDQQAQDAMLNDPPKISLSNLFWGIR